MRQYSLSASAGAIGVREGIGRRDQLDSREHRANRQCGTAGEKPPPVAGLVRAIRGERGQRHEIPPDALGKPQKQFRCDDDGDRGKRECLRARPVVGDQHVGGDEQPGHVRDDGEHVEMLVVQQVESAEGEEHAAEERGRRGELQSPQEHVHPREGRRIVGDQFEVERRLERKQAVEQLVKRMEETDLSLAVKVDARQDRRRPQHRVARSQCLLIEVARRQVEPGQIVGDEDAAGQQRNEQRNQQRGRAGGDHPGKGPTNGHRRPITGRDQYQ